jgi:hypothetical protein
MGTVNNPQPAVSRIIRNITESLTEQKSSDAVILAEYARRYPAIAIQLGQWQERRTDRLNARLARLRAWVASESSSLPKQDQDVLKQEQWELLTLLASAHPDFPIIAMFDKFCATLDAT